MGAGELLIIAILGLIILGPERLPVAIKTVLGWVQSIKQLANGISSEISHELKVQELHQNLKKAEEQGLENLSPELNQSVQELKDAAASVTRQYEDVKQQVETDVANTSNVDEPSPTSNQVEHNKQ